MFELGIFFSLLLIGYFTGSAFEKSHYKSIEKRETELHDLPCRSDHTLYQPATEGTLVVGLVVVSHDFFKKFLAGLRNLFGGRVTVYESLLDRARREAILRMKSEARAFNAREIINLRIETRSIPKSSRQKNSVGAIEVIAYGTAIK